MSSTFLRTLQAVPRKGPDLAWREGFGKRMTEARLAAGLTQAEVAAALSFTEGTVSRWFSGETAPENLQTFARVCAVLSVEAAWLLDISQRGRPEPRPATSAAALRVVRDAKASAAQLQERVDVLERLLDPKKKGS